MEEARLQEQSKLCRIVRSNPAVSILICDNDPDFLCRIKALVEEFFRNRGCKAKIHTCCDGRSLSTWLSKGIDIALLDIDLDTEDYNGIDMARSLRRHRQDSVIIFVTNFIEYAPEGYEVQAFRYILKQKLDKELASCLALALTRFDHVRDVFKFQINGEIIDIPLSEVLYLESSRHKVTAYLQAKQKSHSFHGTLSDLEAQLANCGFLRIHKSYLVNMKHLVNFQCRTATLTGDITLRVSEKNYAENKRKYLLWRGL